MTIAQTRSSKSPLATRLDELLAERALVLEELAMADNRKQLAAQKVNEIWQKETEKPQQRLAEVEEELTQFLSGHRSSLMRRLSPTIIRPEGEVKFTLRAKSLDLPKNVKPIIAFLVAMRGGDQYLTWTPTLNKDALTQADLRLLKKLRPFGVWVTKHHFISVKSPGEKDPKVLVRRRFREPRRRNVPAG